MPELVIDDGDGAGGQGTDLSSGTGGNEPDDGSGGPPSDGTGGHGADGNDGTGGDGETGGSGGSGGTGGMDGNGTGGGSGGGAPAPSGYYESGDWHGFAFPIVIAGTIEPEDFSDVDGPPFCVSGQLEPTEAYEGLGGIGWNLNQGSCMTAGCSPPLGTATPTHDGIELELDNPDGNLLRIQVEEPNADANPDARWCVQLDEVDGKVFLPWTSFNTTCWDPSGGTYYAGGAIETLMVFAVGEGPGGSEVSFDFCIDGIKEADAPSTTCNLDDAAGAGSYTLTPGQHSEIEREGRSYLVHNAFDNADSNQVLAGTGTAFELTEQSGNVSTAGAPLGFSSVFIGELGGLSSDASKLPIRTSDVSSLPTAWAWSGGGGGSYLVRYELFFAMNAQSSPVASIQILLGGSGNIQPIGSLQGTVTVEGQPWELWKGPGSPEGTVYSFRAAATRASLTGDLKDYITVAEGQGLSPTLYLTAIAAGFEVWSGGVGLTSENFCAIVP